MRTVEVTRQTIHAGTECLIIYRNGPTFYVCHENPRMHTIVLPGGTYDTYGKAHDRLEAEVRAHQ